MPEQFVFILRGVSGSGKSHFARNYNGAKTKTTIVSADNYFMKDGQYSFDYKLLKQAHNECYELFKQAIINGDDYVFVDNTNIQRWQFKRYVDFAENRGIKVDFVIFYPKETPEYYFKRNTHNVPLDVIKNQIKNWED